MAKSIVNKTLLLDDAGQPNGVRFEFTRSLNGQALEWNFNDLSPEMQFRAGVHGISQKGGDSYANAKGNALTDEDIKNGLDNIWSSITTNEKWNQGRTSSGGELFTAFTRFAMENGKTVAEAADTFREMEDDDKKELRKHPKIKKHLADIAKEKADAAEKLADDSDAEDLIAKFF